MLRLLRIRNLAVIEAAEVELGPGFTVLTGETGAGKSILVEAVGLLLGARASADLVRTGEDVAWIEALFEGDEGTELVIRREITSQGRSRSFVNGALATAGALRDLALRLVELHGQHEHQALLDPDTHLPLLDSYAGLTDSAAAVAEAWTALSGWRTQLDRAGMDRRERQARLDLIDFELGDIERVSPAPGEDDALAATRQVLASAERIERLCADSYAALYDNDEAILSVLGGIRKRLGELAAIDPAFAPHLAASDGVKLQLEDLASFIRDYRRRVDASPDRLAQVEERLAGIERLKRKYGPTLEDVLARARSLRQDRERLADAGERGEEIRRQLDQATARYLERARALSTARRSAATRFARAVEALLAELAMARTRVELRFGGDDAPPEGWGPGGLDRAEIFVSPNPGEELRPLARIVSGGELSRMMLALKTLAARQRRPSDRPDVPVAGVPRTLVFDEVDAGIGGEVAGVVGARLQELGAEFQVLCITHLPQIAAHGGAHLGITKVVQRGRTLTRVTPLAGEARVQELARMIGGAQLTPAVVASARDLLAHARPGQAKAKGESESPARGESESRRRRR